MNHVKPLGAVHDYGMFNRVTALCSEGSMFRRFYV